MSGNILPLPESSVSRFYGVVILRCCLERQADFFTSLLSRVTVEHGHKLFTVGGANPDVVVSVKVEVEASGTGRHPQLAQRALTAEDNLGAVFKGQGQDTCRIFVIDIDTGIVDGIFKSHHHIVQVIVKF